MFSTKKEKNHEKPSSPPKYKKNHDIPLKNHFNKQKTTRSHLFFSLHTNFLILTRKKKKSSLEHPPILRKNHEVKK